MSSCDHAGDGEAAGVGDSLDELGVDEVDGEEVAVAGAGAHPGHGACGTHGGKHEERERERAGTWRHVAPRPDCKPIIGSFLGSFYPSNTLVLVLSKNLERISPQRRMRRY